MAALLPFFASPMVESSPMVPVVGPQFCEPSTLMLTVTKKALSFSGGDFTVSSINSSIRMKVQGRVGFQYMNRVLYDSVFTPIISMRRNVFSMGRTWKVYRGDSNDQRDLLFTVKRSNIFQVRTKLNVFLAANTVQQRCDFKVKASLFGRSCTFYLGDSDTVIAHMNREYKLNTLLGKDTFSATVYPNVDYAFVVAVIVILDEIYSDS